MTTERRYPYGSESDGTDYRYEHEARASSDGEHLQGVPGVKALDNVSLTVRAGTVHALMGENGAGKSTLMKCLFGVYSKDGGRIFLEGQEVSFRNSKEALEHGVAMVHQELNQALKRNVMDNMWLGRFPKIATGIPLTSEKKMYDATKKLFDELEINVDPRTVMSKMPVSQRQMVENREGRYPSTRKSSYSTSRRPR